MNAPGFQTAGKRKSIVILRESISKVQAFFARSSHDPEIEPFIDQSCSLLQATLQATTDCRDATNHRIDNNNITNDTDISNTEDEFSNAEIDEMLLQIARTDNQKNVCNQDVAGTDDGDEIWNVELDEELDQTWNHIQEVSALKFTITQLREEISTKNAIIERKDADIRQLREELEKMHGVFSHMKESGVSTKCQLLHDCEFTDQVLASTNTSPLPKKPKKPKKPINLLESISVDGKSIINIGNLYYLDDGDRQSVYSGPINLNGGLYLICDGELLAFDYNES